MTRVAAFGLALAATAWLIGAGPRAVDPALFAPGSCVAYAPTAGHRGLTVFIDAGHGGPDPGAVGTTAGGTTVREAALTVRVALDALPLLRHMGFRVVLSRTGPAAVARPRPGDLVDGAFTGAGVLRDLTARDRCANRARASILVGVYFDASTSTVARGSLTLYDAARPFSAQSRRLADLVQRNVLAALAVRGVAVPDDGVRTDVGFGSAVTNVDRTYGHLVILGPAKAGYLATPSRMPGALIEPLFLTNPADAAVAASARGQRAIAHGLASAVEGYLSGSYGSPNQRDRRLEPNVAFSAASATDGAR